MPHPQFDRSKLRIRPLADRPNRVELPRDAVYPGATPKALSAQTRALLEECVARMRAARKNGRPVMLAFGAHTIIPDFSQWEKLWSFLRLPPL